jgi:hypothetical protein
MVGTRRASSIRVESMTDYDIYIEGYEARLAGDEAVAPYPEGTDRADRWYDGYYECMAGDYGRD